MVAFYSTLVISNNLCGMSRWRDGMLCPTSIFLSLFQKKALFSLCCSLSKASHYGPPRAQDGPNITRRHFKFLTEVICRHWPEVARPPSGATISRAATNCQLVV